jgi:uncharacterized protein (DUF1800 family)
MDIQQNQLTSNDTLSIREVATNLASLTVVATALSACGDDIANGIGGGTQSSPAEPAPSAAQSARFLQQASFSSSEKEIETLQSIGYRQWIENQLHLNISNSNWDWLLQNGFLSDANKNGNTGASNVIWQRLISAPDILRQRMALALSELFVVGIDGINLSYRPFVMAAWWDLLCKNAFGDYRSLLEAVTLSPAMGKYLNMSGNKKENAKTGQLPDENYAREILQLFSIGLYELNIDGTLRLNGEGKPIETYTQESVTNLARVLTGWSITKSTQPNPQEYTRIPMELDPTQHSMLEAKFLGITIPANTDGRSALTIALDTIAKHPNVAPFFSKQLIQRLVTSNPSPAYVSRVAKIFNENGEGKYGDLSAVLRAVLLDSEARDDNNIHSQSFGKLREPIIRFIQWGRTFNVQSTNGLWEIGALDQPEKQLAQQPLDSPSVFNFFRPNYTPPNTPIASNTLVAPEFQIVNESSVAGYLNFMQWVISQGIGKVIPDYTAQLALVEDPVALVAHLNLTLCAQQLSEETKTIIINAISKIKTTSSNGQKNRVYAAIFLTISSLDYLIQK